ncbi:MAG TPA: hypothetical protein VHO06_16040 [Polyangia bacterium]|nr:hypothetical protein [Polyangia bacterium]
MMPYRPFQHIQNCPARTTFLKADADIGEAAGWVKVYSLAAIAPTTLIV